MQLYNRESFEGDSIVNLYYFCIFISENQIQPNFTGNQFYFFFLCFILPNVLCFKSVYFQINKSSLIITNKMLFLDLLYSFQYALDQIQFFLIINRRLIEPGKF